ncbi:MAG TPA: type 4a pilus biogenesis protein PilO [Candidatus Saccharimonadales bacterium]|nr:type 4a pilus biogenesis protein PilO [Candidatus Saccharimonadales bacterium]
MKQPVTGKALNLGKRQKIEKANNAILVIVAVAAVFVSMALVTCNFLWKQIQHNDRVYKKEKSVSNLLKENVTSAQNLSAQYQLINSSSSVANAQTILDALPPTYDNPDLLASIQTVVEQSGLSLVSLTSTDLNGQVSDMSATPAPVQIPFSLQVSGTYQQVNTLVTNLENTIRPMDVEAIVLSGTDSSMTATLTVNTYYQPVKSLNVSTQEVK